MAVTWITAADLSASADPYAESAAAYASWILYKLTAEKYPGVRTSVEWLGTNDLDPLQCSTFTDYGDFTWISERSVTSGLGIRLRGQPVLQVLSVADASGIVDPSEYHIVNKSTLARVDRRYFDMTEGLTVTYRHGVKPPVAGIFAAKRLADELVLAMNGDEEACALPVGTQSVTRQGTSVQLIDPQQFLDKGRIGVYEIDLFIAAANPGGARKKPTILSPNLPRGERYS